MIGRPENAETAPYYFTYIDQVAGENVLSTLERQVEDSLGFFSTIPEEKSFYRYEPGKWSIRQLLNHINDSERAFAFRALWFSRGFDTPLPGYDQNVAAAGAEADRIGWTAHIEEFRRVRLATISLFSNLPSAAWDRRGIASGNPFTVRSLAYIIAGHLNHHVTALRERYLRV